MLLWLRSRAKRLLLRRWLGRVGGLCWFVSPPASAEWILIGGGLYVLGDVYM